ncbi:MAG: bifunctional phosphopantothenoylcysteine decarboxylase/phosphopantothenate--cysteine ligase CoaBC [Ruminococcaceae bacterium]|nr:bifunctional phosphopantothenoylcysteine decarboxylase/phosphopantothenate--cysteine ligase CoaBC [Oscillospiraceae bacterium]
MSKNIVVAVCGGIAVYKTVDLVSRLKKKGHNVYVMMTKSACEFVTPLTFQTMSQNEVVTDMFAPVSNWEVEHISLATKADVMLVCPATANIIGKIASGIADDFVTTTIMATKAPKVICPAMNNNMYDNVVVQRNLSKLKNDGCYIVEPGEGFLACGTVGKGRLTELENIEDAIEEALCTDKDLLGKRVLVTAGPTREAIDPVRYITNHSSGKMGYEIAKRARIRGAEVTLVSGQVSLRPFSGINIIPVTSAQDMYNAVINEYDHSDIVIKAAAVADFTPKDKSEHKIKKSDSMSLELTKNPDILMNLGEKKAHQVLVGFCMETKELMENARKKLAKKNLDFIVANNLNTKGAGFGTDTNVVTIIDKLGNEQSLDIMSKGDVADIVLDKALEFIRK